MQTWISRKVFSVPNTVFFLYLVKSNICLTCDDSVFRTYDSRDLAFKRCGQLPKTRPVIEVPNLDESVTEPRDQASLGQVKGHGCDLHIVGHSCNVLSYFY